MPKRHWNTTLLLSSLLGLMLLCSGCFTSPEQRFQHQLESAQHGNRRAQVQVGEAYLKKADGPNAVRWFETAANRGSAQAAVKLAGMYYYGEGVPKDEGKSLDWTEKAAKLGDAYSQYSIGYAYIRGTEPKVDIPIGIDWLKKAAEQHQPDAGYLLGSLYLGAPVENVTLPADYAQARKYLSQAGLDGHGDAAGAYAYMLEHGEGGDVDKVEAFAWYALAISEDSEKAYEYGGKLAKSMTKAELNAAQLRAVQLGFRKGVSESKRRRRERRIAY